MHKMTERQWDEYRSIVRRCNTLEIEARSCRALDAQLKKAQVQVVELRGEVAQLNTLYETGLKLHREQVSVLIAGINVEKQNAESEGRWAKQYMDRMLIMIKGFKALWEATAKFDLSPSTDEAEAINAALAAAQKE